MHAWVVDYAMHEYFQIHRLHDVQIHDDEIGRLRHTESGIQIWGNQNRNISPTKLLHGNDMTKKVSRPRLSRKQKKILDILAKYGELTARDIAEILWARDISYKTAEYSSTARSLRTLHRKGLVTKVGGQIKWRRTKEGLS